MRDDPAVTHGSHLALDELLGRQRRPAAGDVTGALEAMFGPLLGALAAPLAARGRAEGTLEECLTATDRTDPEPAVPCEALVDCDEGSSGAASLRGTPSTPAFGPLWTIRAES